MVQTLAYLVILTLSGDSWFTFTYHLRQISYDVILQEREQMLDERGAGRSGIQKPALHLQRRSSTSEVLCFLFASHFSPSLSQAFSSFSFFIVLSPSPIPSFNLSHRDAPFLFFKPVIHFFLSVPSISLCLCSCIASLLKGGPLGSFSHSLPLAVKKKKKHTIGI